MSSQPITPLAVPESLVKKEPVLGSIKARSPSVSQTTLTFGTGFPLTSLTVTSNPPVSVSYTHLTLPTKRIV